MKKMIKIFLTMAVIFALTACNTGSDNDDSINISFAQARAEFTTNLTRQVNNQAPIPTPPNGMFDIVHYDSDVGPLAAFISPDPGDGERHPLIIWIVGGWSYGISSLAWSYPDWDNDQTGSAFREAGILMMYPSFRGANGNPGYFETLFSDIDDILSAYEFAASLPYVDPDRIYLGGHSTGGTRVLLASALSDNFRAVFSFGPVYDIGNHNRSQFTFNINDREERRMRSPGHWLRDINSPTFIIEGAGGNAADLRNLEESSANNDNVHTFLVEGGDHFDILAPITRMVAQKILDDTNSEFNIILTDSDMQTAMNNEPDEPLMPTMIPHHNESLGISFLLPIIWSEHPIYGDNAAAYAPDSYYYNFWESSSMLMEIFEVGIIFDVYELEEILYTDPINYSFSEFSIDSGEVSVWETTANLIEGLYFNKVAAVQNGEHLLVMDFWVPESFEDSARPLFAQIISSIVFE